MLKFSKIEFAKAISYEGIPNGDHYGCIVYEWPWAKKYLKDNYKTKNALEARNNCFHLYLNENYKSKEIDDIINSILKNEKYYLE